MTPEEQRIALAEWAGWKYSPSANSSIKHEAIMAWYRPGNSPWHLEQLPDYLNDLNAVHLLEKKLTFEQAEQFEDELCDIVVKYNEQQENPAPWRFAVAHATAAQRCGAILKTLNIWKP
jgi:hypothetical protein